MSSTSDIATSATTSALRSQARRPPAAPRPPSFRLSCRLCRVACSAGASAEHDAGQHRDGDRVGERAPVEAPVDEVRNAVGRNAAVDQLEAGPREHHAERRAEQADHDRLGQQLPDDAPAAGAKRGADRDLAMPDRCAREQQVGDVRAGDHQHQRHGAHHRQDDQLRFVGQHPVARAAARRRSSRRSRRDRRRPGGSRRPARSARACAMVTPGFIRANTWSVRVVAAELLGDTARAVTHSRCVSGNVNPAASRR